MNNLDIKYNFKDGAKWDLPVYLNRQNPIPLDGTSVYKTLEEAQTYATSDPKAYPGQIISVVTDTEVKVYKINNGKLEELGKGSLVTDQNPNLLATTDNIGQIIYLTKDVKVTEGSGEVTYSSGPYIVSGNGTVSKIGTASVSGDIAGDVTALQGKVSTLESTVGKKGSGSDNPSTGLVKDVEDLAKKDTELADKINTFAGIATPSTNPGTPDGPVFYFATQAGVYSNFSGLEVKNGEAVILQWNSGTWAKSAFKPMTDFDSVFDADGKSLTEFESGIIYDVSAHNDGVVFESLSALLNSSSLSTLIPTSVRCGGMSIRFIQSSYNKYVQYRLTNQSWSIDVDDWQEIGSAEFSTGEKVSEVGIDNEPTDNSKNLINSGSVATIQKGNLKKKSGITTIDLSLSDFTLKYDLLATISNGHLVSSGTYNVYYKQMDVDSRIMYKLGASALEGNAAIFVCDTIPANNVSFSNAVERVANAIGDFYIQRGQYLCIQGYSTISTYLPAYLKKEYDNYESVNIFDKLGEKAPDSTIKSDSVWDAIEEVGNKESANATEIKKIVPFMVDTMAFFWTHKQATNFNQNNPFKISGIANSNTLNVLSGGQTTSVLTSADKLASIVIKFDDGTCKPYMLTGWTEDTLTIYPTIDKSITDGEVVPLMNDSQHLTIYGYHAYSQHLFEENPRYCEKNKYIKRYNGGITSIRFSALSGTPNRYEADRNDNDFYSCQYGNSGIFLIPYTDYLTESQYGYQWEVSTKNIKGYVESYVGVCNGFYPANTFTLDEGYEIHIEGWIDGVKSFEKIKDNIFIERICIPFEKDDDKVKIKIYLTKMRNTKDTLYIGATTFWVNESSRTNMIEPHEVVSQLFDSWGDYDATDYIEDEDSHKWYQGSSGKELQRLINDKNGIIIPYFNRSKGSMTTRWGKSWWYHNVWSIHPDIMLTDFGINDYHTNISATFPNFKDPYGNIISMATPVTATEFAQNMETLFEMCVRHNIYPIYVMCSRIGCDNVDYINNFVTAHAKQITI